MMQLQEAYTRAVEKASASTVNISRVAGPPGPPRHRDQGGFGSGVVLDAQGHILTNHHVVESMQGVIVTLADGQVLGGTVVGGDEDTDIAVIKVEGKGFHPADFGDSEALKVGQPVLAIGNPLGLSGGPTVTSGVVSSLRRSLQFGNGHGMKVIQTDAAVNPGNSGGALVDLEGKVVGITTAQMPWAKGIAFAVPINDARDIAQQLIQHGRVQRPWLGISGYDVNPRLAGYYGLTTPTGVFITEVTPASPAATAGLQVGDVVVSLGGKPVAGPGDLIEGLRDAGIGKAVELEVERHGHRRTLRATPAARPF